MLNKSVSLVFLTMSHSFFVSIFRWVLKAYFGSKQLKVQTIIESCNSVIPLVQELMKYEKELVYDPTLTLFSIFGCMKKVNYEYWKSLVSVHLGRHYKNMYMVAFSRFLTYFYFTWKSTLRHLDEIKYFSWFERAFTEANKRTFLTVRARL